MAAADAPAGSPACSVVLMTAMRPGAIAILQLAGDVEPVLAAMSGRGPWPVGCARLAGLGSIDQGIIARPAAGVAQIMPHGGVRVVQRLLAWLAERGVERRGAADADPEALFPEARDGFEALALLATARAASPLAVDLVLDQPRRFRAGARPGPSDLERSRRLNRLIDPPLVVIAGPANVGKSTLSNALLGRSMSIAADAPGTTRDYTCGRVELAGLVVDWHDTPGLRAAPDAIEARAVELAMRLLERADLVVAMTDQAHGWPTLPRPADLRIAGKCDLGRRDDADLCVSALTGDGIDSLVSAVRDRLVSPADLAHPGPWLFDDRLHRLMAAPTRGSRRGRT